MKQLLILSGKGGTGKTTIASAFIKLAEAKAYADCDVDAPNLHLVMSQTKEPDTYDYFGLPKAQINQDVCVECGLCREICRFDAIQYDNGYEVDSFACEGCGVCEVMCPVGAISLKPVKAGEIMLYEGKDCVFSTAQLKMGSGTSGLLVTEVKKKMKSAAKGSKLAIIDGSPGIGCPVIASISGVDFVLIVAEPSVSGISDMDRMIKTAEKFQVEMAVCVNKYDTSHGNTRKVESYCKKHNLPFVGKIPFDLNVVKAINEGNSIVDIECAATYAIKEIFEKTLGMVFKDMKEVDEDLC